MKKLLTALLFVFMTLFPVISMAGVAVRANIPLPPPLPFIAPPHVVVLPGMDVYAVPDIEEEIFFREGWWWRHWDNRWYRSRYHNHGWAYYRGHPVWYGRIPHDWRDNYRNRVWSGHQWDHRPIPHGDLDRHWRDGRWRDDHGWRHPDGPDRGPHERDRGPRGWDRGPRGHDGPGDRR
jgi:hypothetical protein